MSLTHRSQSALEYMMTYGWAILIIVIVAAVLYSFGIFSPSSSISATVTGFSNLGSVAAQCTANGVLRINLGDSTGYSINITSITAKDSSTGQISTFKPNSTVDSNPIIDVGGSYIFSVPNVCPPAGTHYSISTTVNYTEPGQPLPGPYTSSGTISGTVSATNLPPSVPYFNGVNAYLYSSGTLNGLPVGRSARTVTAWFYATNLTSSGGGRSNVFVYGTTNCNPDSMFHVYINYGSAPNIVMNAWCTDTSISGVVAGKWYFVSYAINGSSTPNGDTFQTGYTASYGGNLVLAKDGPYNISTSSVSGIDIANPYGSNYYFQGYITNIQIYNFELSQAQIQTLVNEGIYGAPVTTSGLVAWYPLNGSLSSYLVSNTAFSSANAVFTSDYPTP